MKMYQKALKYKEKYLHSCKFIKKYYEKKMVKYLKEADQKNCPEASYALAVCHSSGVECNIIDLENTKTEEQ